MINLFDAAWEVHTFLTTHQVPYVFIGGLAVQYWGEPRFTHDLDLTVAMPAEEVDDFVHMVTDFLSSRVDDPMSFAQRTRMVLVKASNGCQVDISLALPGYEDHVMARAVEIELEPQKSVQFCSAEDLIIHKAIAKRPRDIQDIEGIVYRQQDRLDVDYIRLWLNEFANLLADPDLLTPFEKAWRKLKSSGNRPEHRKSVG